jgi:hypothetical protein
MNLRRFGEHYIDLDKIAYAHTFRAEVVAPHMINAGRMSQGGVRIGFGCQDHTIYDNEEGYEALLSWLKEMARAA